MLRWSSRDGEQPGLGFAASGCALPPRRDLKRRDQDFAAACLDAGQWSSAIDDIVTSPQPIISEVGPALEQVLADQGVGIPDAEAAIWALLRFCLGDIASGAVPPRAGLQRVMEDVYYAADLSERTDKYVGDSHELEKLIGYYYAYEDLEGRPTEVSCDGLYGQAAIDALGRHIVESSRDWMRRHGDAGQE